MTVQHDAPLRRRTVAAFPLALLLLPALAAAAPEITFDEMERSLGRMEQHEEKSTIFVFTNTGDEDLIVTDAKTGCGCTAAVPTKGPIPPGAKGQVRVSYNSKEAMGNQSQMIVVEHNAPARRTQITVHAFVRTDLYIPTFVNFGRNKHGELLEREIEVKSDPAVDFELLCIKTNRPFISAAFVPGEPEEGYGATYKVTVSLLKDTPPGNLDYRVILETNLPEQPTIEVPVYGKITGNLDFSADRVNFGIYDLGTAKTATLTIEAPEDHPIEITAARSTNSYVTASLREVRKGRSYRVRCEVSPRAPGGGLKGMLVIETNDPAEPRWEIPLTGFSKS